jgi:hypothetical protein
MQPFEQFDLTGSDLERLKNALNGATPTQVMETLLQHLYWWNEEAPPPERVAHERVFNLIGKECELMGLQLHWGVYGTVTTLDGKIVEKVEHQEKGPKQPSNAV